MPTKLTSAQAVNKPFRMILALLQAKERETYDAEFWKNMPESFRVFSAYGRIHSACKEYRNGGEDFDRKEILKAASELLLAIAAEEDQYLEVLQDIIGKVVYNESATSPEPDRRERDQWHKCLQCDVLFNSKCEWVVQENEKPVTIIGHKAYCPVCWDKRRKE